MRAHPSCPPPRQLPDRAFRAAVWLRTWRSAAATLSIAFRQRRRRSAAPTVSSPSGTRSASHRARSLGNESSGASLPPEKNSGSPPLVRAADTWSERPPVQRDGVAGDLAGVPFAHPVPHQHTFGGEPPPEVGFGERACGRRPDMTPERLAHRLAPAGPPRLLDLRAARTKDRSSVRRRGRAQPVPLLDPHARGTQRLLVEVEPRRCSVFADQRRDDVDVVRCVPDGGPPHPGPLPRPRRARRRRRRRGRCPPTPRHSAAGPSVPRGRNSATPAWPAPVPHTPAALQAAPSVGGRRTRRRCPPPAARCRRRRPKPRPGARHCAGSSRTGSVRTGTAAARRLASPRVIFPITVSSAGSQRPVVSATVAASTR